jgi:hypothetical protein
MAGLREAGLACGDQAAFAAINVIDRVARCG